MSWAEGSAVSHPNASVFEGRVPRPLETTGDSGATVSENLLRKYHDNPIFEFQDFRLIFDFQKSRRIAFSRTLPLIFIQNPRFCELGYSTHGDPRVTISKHLLRSPTKNRVFSYPSLSLTKNLRFSRVGPRYPRRSGVTVSENSKFASIMR